ncbi:hypothetical protein CY35_15G040100 [Sphagnum magellanicum]|nr:hypothetical protein CY35_15G040100 [Sphagnum magellanicum]
MEPVKDDSRPAVSGAAVDAFAERLKGEIGGSTAYDLATAAGNGSLRPLTSQVPILSSSVPLATGSSTPTGSGQQVTWDQLTKHQQQLYLQRKEMLQRQQQQQQQLLAASQASKKSGGISQGISFGALMPLLQAHLPPEQNQQLNSLYQKFKQSEITREDFVRGARVIVGDQVLVTTIRHMHLKQQQQQQSQQPQHSSSSGNPSPMAAAATVTQGSSSKPMPDQTTAAKPIQLSAEQLSASRPPAQPLQAASLQQQQKEQEELMQTASQAHQQSIQQPHQQPKLEVQPHTSLQSNQTKPPLPLPPQQSKPSEQAQLTADSTEYPDQHVTPSMLSQQAKHEVEKPLVTTQPARPHVPLQQPQITPSPSPFASFQPRPPLITPQTVGPVAHPSQSQVQRVSTLPQFSAMPAQSLAAQLKPGVSSPTSDSSLQPEKPLSKYAKQKLRKEQKRREEEERIRKLQEEDRLRRLQTGPTPMMPVATLSTAPQSAPLVSVPLQTPQPHPKLLEKQQLGQQTLMAVKQEPQIDQHTSGIQTSQSSQPLAKVQEIHSGQQVGVKQPGQMQLSEAGSLPSPLTQKDVVLNGAPGEQIRLPTSQPVGGLVNIPSTATLSPTSAFASSLPQSPASVRQVSQQPHTGPVSVPTTPPSLVNSASVLGPGVGTTQTPSTGGVVPVHGQNSMHQQGLATAPVSQPLSAAVKTPPKVLPLAGQKKPAEPMPQASQPASKKQKLQAGEADQSIDQLNDVTAVSGVNLREEEEQLLAGPKEESRTTAAMRKFVQEEEERLFLEKGPLRTKAQAIAAKCGIKSVSEDVERCLSMCVEERLRSMLYKLIKLSKQRCDLEKDMHKVVVTSDPRRQVLLMKKRSKEASEKKLAEENERLRKLNEKKDKGPLADAENEDLRAKVQKAQQEEEDKMRANAANVAARAAVGADDMLTKWQLLAAEGLAKRQGGGATTNEATRARTVDETSVSREQNRQQDEGGIRSGSGPGRPGTEQEGGAPAVAAIPGRAPGPGLGIHRTSSLRQPGTVQAGRPQRSIMVKDVIAFLEREPQMSKSKLLYRLYEREQKS